MLEILNKEAYETFTKTYPYANFLHAWEELERKKAQGFEVEIIGMKEQHQWVAVAPIIYYPYLKKFRYAYSPRGVLLDFTNKKLLKNFSESLKKYLLNKNVVYLKIDPYIEYQQRDCYGNIVENGENHFDVFQNLLENGYIHQGFTTGYDANAQVRFMHTISLEGKDETTLLKEMSSTCRYSVKHSEYAGLSIHEVKSDEFGVLQKLYEYMAEKNHFTVHDISYIESLYKHYGDKIVSYLAILDMEIYKASLQKEKEELDNKLREYPEELSEKRQRKKKEIEIVRDKMASKLEELKDYDKKEIILSGGTFLLYGNEIVYLMGGSYRDLNYLNASYAIQWKMITYGLKQGYKKYNFYGISGIFDKSCEDYGVLKFKQSFGGQAEELLGDFELPIQVGKYKLTKVVRNLR